MLMGRLDEKLLNRTKAFSHRVIDVAEALSRTRRSRRIVDQIMASGCSVGANIYEADEAQTRPEFARIVAIALREANECRFWLELVAERGWVRPERLTPLLTEGAELRRILGALIVRSRV
jgi:four helix bundle protein